MSKNVMYTSVIVMASLLCVWVLVSMALGYRSTGELLVVESDQSSGSIYDRQMTQFPPAQTESQIEKEVPVSKDVNKVDGSVEENNPRDLHIEIASNNNKKVKSDSTRDVLDILDPNTDGSENVAGHSMLYPHEENREQAIDHLALMLEAEPYDDSWASERTQQLSETFSQHSPVGNQLIQTDCRSTFCRIDIAHIDNEAEQAFISAMMASQQFIDDGEQGSYRRLVDSNGSIRTVFYSAREGHRLPAFNEETE